MREHLKAWRDVRWAFGAVWLCFLLYPVVAVVHSDDLSTGAKAAGIALLAAFALFYTAACVYVMVPGFRGGVRDWRRALGWLVPLGVLAVALAPILHEAVLALAPYFMALAVFQFAFPGAVVAVMVVLVAALVLPEWMPGWHNDTGTTLTLVIVGLVLLMMRVLQVRERARQDMDEQRRRLDEQLAVVAERERVARDVHDILGHSLTVMSLKSELAARLVDVDPARAKAEMEELHTLSREALGEVRVTVGNLRTPDLRTELRSARTALDAAEIRAELPVADEVEDNPVLAWVLREAVTNVVRHSRASSCRVVVDGRGIEIVDDGRGLDGSVYGNGLRGLDERVRGAGGVLEVSSPDGPGTRVAVRLG